MLTLSQSSRTQDKLPQRKGIDMDKSTAEEVASITEEYITALWGTYSFNCELN